jgi:hypothetical protein
MSDIDMDVDQDSDQRPNYEPFAAGEYELFISDYKTGKTKESNRTKMDLELTVDAGPFKGRKMWHTLVFVPKGEPGHGLTVQALKAFGLMQAGETAVSLSFADFKGRTCRAKVIIRPATAEYKAKNEIPPGGFITGEETKQEPPVKQPPAKQTASAGKPQGKRPF